MHIFNRITYDYEKKIMISIQRAEDKFDNSTSSIIYFNWTRTNEDCFSFQLQMSMTMEAYFFK